MSGTCFAESFLSSPLGQKLVEAGIDFVTDPGDFLFDLHHDAMDYTPLPANKMVGIHTNFLLLANPALVNAISGKLALKEGKVLPQVGISAGYWQTMALGILSGSMDSLDASLTGWNIGFFAAKSMDPATRLFIHINRSKIDLSVTLAEPIVLVEDVLTFSTLAANVMDTYIFTGIEYTSEQYDDKIVIAQTGYGLGSKKIVAKILVHKGVWELGLTIYPEGLLVIHPVLNIQVRF